MSKPIIAISMGNPSGIGPELVVRVLQDDTVYERCRPLVIGDAGVIGSAVRLVDANVRVKSVAGLGKADFSPGQIDVLQPAGLALHSVVPGKVDPEMGKAAALCLDWAAELAMARQVDGVVLAPMNKQAFHLAGYDYLDELAYLAELTRSSDVSLLGAVSPVLWTIAVTTHVPFRSIPDLITTARVVACAGQLHDALVRVGLAAPRIAVAALNVHGGEGGMFGREEIDVIGPAVEQARQLGLNVEGPCPADTVFVRARSSEFQGVVCMYHDQANIARKLLATRRGATIYLGLPVVCATTAHGTAFDIAGRGIADPSSLIDTLSYTMMLARAQRNRAGTSREVSPA